MLNARHTPIRVSSLRLFAAATLGLLAAVIAPGVQAGPPEPVDVESCVTYDELDVAADVFDVRLGSSCERSLRCKVEWTTSCTPDSHPEHRSRSFTLRPNASAKARISTQHCKGDDWDVSDVAWFCNEK